MGVSIRTLSGRDIALPDDAIDGLRGSLHGRLLTSDSTGYDEARTIWNAMVERRPALIARCIDAQDVATAVRFARAKSTASQNFDRNRAFPPPGRVSGEGEVSSRRPRVTGRYDRWPGAPPILGV